MPKIEKGGNSNGMENTPVTFEASKSVGTRFVKLLYVVGGGGCLIRNFADYDTNRVIINEDICATEKGYEYMTLVTLNRNGGAA